MIVTFSVLTLTLAKAYGIYVIVTGLSGLTAPDRWRMVMEDFQKSPGLTYLTAVLVVGFGLTMVILHSLWTDPLAIVVSLFGWVSLLKGVLLMAAPDGLLRLGAATVATPDRARTWAVFAVILGAALLTAGVLGRASPSL
jgi:uncharacterized protein YjeT (DUF2065 family)